MTTLEPREVALISKDTELTEPQELVYKTMIRLFMKNQYMPTIQELADELMCYPNSIQGKIKILEEKGYLARLSSKSRTIKFLKLKVELVAA